jgi:hypothetical protein
VHLPYNSNKKPYLKCALRKLFIEHVMTKSSVHRSSYTWFLCALSLEDFSIIVTTYRKFVVYFRGSLIEHNCCVFFFSSTFSFHTRCHVECFLQRPCLVGYFENKSPPNTGLYQCCVGIWGPNTAVVVCVSIYTRSFKGVVGLMF